MTQGLLKHTTFPPHIQEAIALLGLAVRRLAKFVPPEDRVTDTDRRNQCNDASVRKKQEMTIE